MAPAFWEDFNDERDMPSAAAYNLYQDSINESPTWGDYNPREQAELRQDYIDDIATGDVRDLEDWLDTLSIGWSRDDLMEWLEEVDTSQWTYEDWETFQSLYG